MEMSLWYCPNCDKPTGNFRHCSCGTAAVYQRFIMWPVEHTAEQERSVSIITKRPGAGKVNVRGKQAKSYKTLRS